MALMSFTAAPVELTKTIKKQKAIQARGTQKAKSKSSRRKVDMGATVYGDELFQNAYKPTKAIVVKFHPFTLNLIRMETEGRFAIQYYKETNKFLLYRFLTSISYEYKEEELLIPITENVKTYGPFEHVESIRDKILEIIRRQLLEERTKSKQLAIDLEKAEILAKEKAENDAEKIEEQLGSAKLSSVSESDQRETEITSETSAQKEELSKQTIKKESNSSLSLNEIRRPTTNFITKVGKINDLKDLDKIVVKEKVIEATSVMEKLIEEDKIVTIWKLDGNQVKLIVKMPKSKAEKWIKGKANFYIK